MASSKKRKLNESYKPRKKANLTEPEPDPELPNGKETEDTNGANGIDDVPKSNHENANWDVENFRKKLLGTHCLDALEKFIKQYAKNKQIARKYLENGGSCTEILQSLDTLEIKPLKGILFMFEVFNVILLESLTTSNKEPDNSEDPNNTENPSSEKSLEESCQRLLTSHIKSIHSALAPISPVKLKKVTLKLLTSMVTLSSNLAKEILLHINLEPSTVVSLTRTQSHPGDKDVVRTCFIQYFLAFLIDGNPSSIRLLLENKQILQQIVSRLIYDDAQLVTLVLLTFDKYLLHNPLMSKTMKLHIFNTEIIKFLFNLYNWRGPWSKKKRGNPNVHDDARQMAKTHVLETLQQFMVTLLTNPKAGVVFRDKTLGIGATKQNQLLQSVLESLAAPWGHKYVSELVLNIVKSAPDMYHVVLKCLHDDLKPTASLKWLNLITFLKSLIKSLPFTRVDDLKAFTESSLVQSRQIHAVIERFYSPKLFMAVLHVKTLTSNVKMIRYAALSLLHVILSEVFEFVKAANSISDLSDLETVVFAHLKKSLPSIDVLSRSWNVCDTTADEDTFVNASDYETLDFKSMLIDIFIYYLNIDPNQTDRLVVVTPETILDHVQNNEIIFKATDLFMKINQNAFLPHETYFDAYVFELVKNCHTHAHYNTIAAILRRLSIFDNNPMEIHVWLKYVAHADSDTVIRCFLASIKSTFVAYDELQKRVDHVEKSHVSSLDVKIRQSEMSEIFVKYERKFFTKTSDQNSCVLATQKRVCPILLKFLDELTELRNHKDHKDVATHLGKVILDIFHMQTHPKVFLTFVLDPEKDYKIPKGVKKYLTSWYDGFPLPLKFDRSDFTNKRILSNDLLNHSDDQPEIIQININSDEIEDLLEMVVFYFAQLVILASKNDTNIAISFNTNKYVTITKYLLFNVNESGEKSRFTNLAKIIFQHPIIHHYFVPSAQLDKTIENNVSNFVVNLIKNSEFKRNVIELTRVFRQKLTEKCRWAITTYRNTSKIPNDPEMGHFSDLLTHVGLHGINDRFIREICDLEKLENSENSENSAFTKNGQVTIFFHMLTEALKQFPNQGISAATFDKVIDVYIDVVKNIDINIEEFEVIFLKYLDNQKKINDSLYDALLHTFTTSTKISVNRLEIFKRTLKNSTKIDLFISQDFAKIIDKKELIFPIFHGLLDKQAIIAPLVEHFRATYEQFAWKYVEKPAKITKFVRDNIDVVKCLIRVTDHATREQFLTKRLKFDRVDIVHVDLVSSAIGNPPLVNEKIAENYLEFLIESFAFVNKASNINEMIAINKKIDSFITITHDGDIGLENFFKTKIFNKHVKNALKLGLTYATDLQSESDELSRTRTEILQTFTLICDRFDATKNVDEIVLIHEMIISHSDFLTILLSTESGHNGHKSGHKSRKSRVLELILILSQKVRSVMSENLVPVFLSAYTATLSECDRVISDILMLYEASSVNLYRYKPYVWGDFAIKHYSVRNNRIERALYRQPTMKQIIDLFNPAIIVNTIENFDIERGYSVNQLRNGIMTNTFNWMDINDSDKIGALSVFKPKLNDKWTGNDTKQSRDKVYDPCFYLPIFAEILSSESVVQCYKFTESGALSLTLLALASRCAIVRQAAYVVLARFYFHLEASRNIKEKTIWIQFIDCIRRGLSSRQTSTQKPAAVSLIPATFLARVALTITEPLNPLYLPLTNYMFVKDTFNFDTIPEFLALFHSNDVNAKTHRNWILCVIRDGIRKKPDLNLLHKSYIFKFIMDFYNSNLSDRDTRVIILQILLRCLQVPRAGVNMLVIKLGLLSWLQSVVDELSGVAHTQFHYHDRVLRLLAQILKCIARELSRHSATLEGRLYFKLVFNLYTNLDRVLPKDVFKEIFGK